MFAKIMLVVIIGFFAIVCIACVQGRYKLLMEGRIIKREKNFYDYAEIFTLKSIALEAVCNRLNTRLQDIRSIQIELQPQDKSLAFTGRACHRNFRGILKQEITPGENQSFYRFRINEYQTQNGMPDTTTLNLLYTAVERTFLDFDSKTKITTEYVQRTIKR